MTRWADPSFSTYAPGDQQYRDNWDRIFQRRERAIPFEASLQAENLEPKADAPREVRDGEAGMGESAVVAGEVPVRDQPVSGVHRGPPAKDAVVGGANRNGDARDGQLHGGLARGGEPPVVARNAGKEPTACPECGDGRGGQSIKHEPGCELGILDAAVSAAKTHDERVGDVLLGYADEPNNACADFRGVFTCEHCNMPRESHGSSLSSSYERARKTSLDSVYKSITEGGPPTPKTTEDEPNAGVTDPNTRDMRCPEEAWQSGECECEPVNCSIENACAWCKEAVARHLRRERAKPTRGCSHGVPYPKACHPCFVESGITHESSGIPFRARCGADVPNSRTTGDASRVNCPECLKVADNAGVTDPNTRDMRCPECGQMMTNHVVVTRHENSACTEQFTGPPLTVAARRPCVTDPRDAEYRERFAAGGVKVVSSDSSSVEPKCSECAWVNHEHDKSCSRSSDSSGQSKR